MTLCSKLLLTVCSPDETLFAEVGGAPAEPPPERARAAQQWRSTACQALSLAATLLECATRLELSAVQPAGGASRPSQAGAGASQQPAAFPAIVELPSGSGGEEASVAQEAQAEVVRRCLLACAMYGLDGELPGQWSDAACDTAAQALLARCALAASLPQLPPSQRLVESCSSLALLDAAAAQQQELLAAALPRLLLPPLRSVLLQPPGDKPAPASTIPHSTFTRTLAARQLAWLVRRLVHPFLGAQLPVLLPLVLACADEGAPSVAWQGLEALRHISQVSHRARELNWLLLG